jgi:hypothetical protein
LRDGTGFVGIAVLGEEKADRFRQPDHQRARDYERQHAADQKHHRPAEIGENVGVEESADGAAERKGGPDQARNHRAAPLWRVFRGERDEARRRAAKSDPGNKANHQQLIVRVGARRQERADAEDDGRRDQAALASEAIAERPERQRANHGAEKRRGEDRPQRGFSEAQLVGNQWRSDGDRLAVETVEERDQ